jgi:hypothetical protein
MWSKFIIVVFRRYGAPRHTGDTAVSSGLVATGLTLTRLRAGPTAARRTDHGDGIAANQFPCSGRPKAILSGRCNQAGKPEGRGKDTIEVNNGCTNGS